MKKTFILLLLGLLIGKFLSFSYYLIIISLFFIILYLKKVFIQYKIDETSVLTSIITVFCGILISYFNVSCFISVPDLNKLNLTDNCFQFYGIPNLVYKNQSYILYKISNVELITSKNKFFHLNIPVYFCSKTPLLKSSYYYLLPKSSQSVNINPNSILIKNLKLIFDKTIPESDFHNIFHRWISSRVLLLNEKFRHFYEKIICGIAKHPPGQLSLLIKSLGLSHLLAISGLHFSILFLFIRSIKIRTMTLTLLIPLFYLYLLNFRPSAFRSFIMLSCFLIAQNKKRKYYGYRFLYFSMIIITIFAPEKLLTYSTLFSFTATFALLKCLPVVNKLNSFFRISFTIFIFSSGLTLLLGETIFFSAILLNPVIIPVFSVIFICCLGFTLLPLCLSFITVPLINFIIGLFTDFLDLFTFLQNLNFNIDSEYCKFFLIFCNCIFLISELYKNDEFQ